MNKKNKEFETMKNEYNNQFKILKNENISLKKRERMYKDILSKLKSFSDMNQNNLNQGFMNNSYYTYNPTRGSEFNINSIDRDDSIRYSYHLIENLKNSLNKVDMK